MATSTSSAGTHHGDHRHKPSLSLSQIINMNFGFFGIQYSFGLQQTAINPIYTFLHAKPDELPILNLAGPMTGLLIQPIIGALSDKTWSPRWGRRKPYFLIGAITCSIALFFMPFSSALWMAAGLLWILDAGNNTAVEPYRAFVADKLPRNQFAKGFLTQSFFTGLGITLANLSLLMGSENRVILSSSEGNYKTHFKKIKFVLHGATANTLSVNGTVMPLTNQVHS